MKVYSLITPLKTTVSLPVAPSNTLRPALPLVLVLVEVDMSPAVRVLRLVDSKLVDSKEIPDTVGMGDKVPAEGEFTVVNRELSVVEVGSGLRGYMSMNDSFPEIF
jgi:hypothetical protein